jgi:hypothetical protein
VLGKVEPQPLSDTGVTRFIPSFFKRKLSKT